MKQSNLDTALSTLHTMLLSNKRLTVSGEAKVVQEAIQKDMEFDINKLTPLVREQTWVKLPDVLQIIRKER